MAVAFVNALLRRVVDGDRAEGRFQRAVKPDLYAGRSGRNGPAHSGLGAQRKGMRPCGRWGRANNQKQNERERGPSYSQSVHLCVGPMVPQGVQVKTAGQMSSRNR